MRSRIVRVTLISGLLAASWGGAHAAEFTATDLTRYWVEKAGDSAGICAVIGCDDVDVAFGVARCSDYFVHVLDPRAPQVSVARVAADAQNLAVPQMVIEQAPLNHLPHADNVVDLLLAVDPPDGTLTALTLSEVLRVLRPDGRAIIGFSSASANSQSRKKLKRWAETEGARLAQVSKNRFGYWAEITKPPMAGADDWSHWEHGPDNNPVSSDTVIRAPYMTQWMGEPYYITMPAITTAAGGRTFLATGHIAHHKREEPWLNMLLARNGYNGAELWRRRLPDGYLVHRSAFIATDDVFYMIDLDGNGCLLLDPKTGVEEQEIRLPDMKSEWKWIALKNETLFVLAGGEPDPPETTIVRSQRGHWSWGELSQGYYAPRVPWGFGTTITAYDLARDRVRWSHTEDTPIDSRAMALGDDGVFFYAPEAHAGRLDEKTGQPVWINDDAKTRKLIEQPGAGLSSTPGFRTTVFSLYTPEGLFYAAQTRMNVVALSPEDGQLMWHRPKTSSNPNTMYVNGVSASSEVGGGGQLLVGIGPEGSTLVVNPKTGEVLEDLDFAKRSCARLTATPDSFFCRGMPEGITRYDRVNHKVLFNGAIRPACNDGVIGANGLLYVGPWTCDCNLTLMGTVAMCTADEVDAPSVPRLERAPGDSAPVANLAVTPEDWPTYRANNEHSSSANVRLSNELGDLWTYRPPRAYKPTAATAAGSFMFLAGNDGKVRAINTATGTLAWSYQTAGPIMQPPTIWNGRAYVGSGDGYVYALEATTGRLLWRFRAAPKERRIMIHGSLCSTWPVNSGVLVQDGVAYAAAGIVDYDGTYVYALDAATGEVKWQNITSGHLDPELRKGVSAQGGLTIANGRLWMAGGNVVSPASYDLDTGKYLGPEPGDGSPRANRGEEIGIFDGEYVVSGGRLRYSARENVVNPGAFSIAQLATDPDAQKGMPLCWGRIPPAWNQDYVVAVNGPSTLPQSFRAADVAAYVKEGNEQRRPQSATLSGIPPNSDVIALALAHDRAVIVCKVVQPGRLAPAWRILLADLTQGRVTWQRNLPAAALPGGVLIDREGRVAVILENGGVVSFGGTKMIRAHVNAIRALAQASATDKQEAIALLVGLLGRYHGPDVRGLVMDTLADLGVEVGREAREAGCITRWHLIGPVPWNPRTNTVDTVFVGEPDVDISEPAKLGSSTLTWREYNTELSHGTMELNRLYGIRADAAIYAYAEVDLSAQQSRDVLLKVGSNDGFKCWFNGKEAGRFDGGRSYRPDQDTLSVLARPGINTVLLKVTQMGGGWGFGARLTDTQNNPINLAGPAPRGQVHQTAAK